MDRLIGWRDRGLRSDDIVGRRIACGLGLLGLGILGSAESITFLALAILASPFELVGVRLRSEKFQFARCFALRSCSGGLLSILALTIHQVGNVYAKSLKNF